METWLRLVRRFLNVAPQEEALYPELTGRENLEFFAQLYGVPRPDRVKRVDDALETIELSARQHDRVHSYSGGMRRRLNLGCALVSAPRLILLDEPTVGVDPQSRAHIFQAVNQLRSEGVTILYTTHYLQEAEDLCDRIAIMDEGRLEALGTLPELLSLSRASEVIELRLARESERAEAFRRTDGVERLEVSGTLVRIYTRDSRRILSLLCSSDLLGAPIVQIRVTPISLETIFLELTGKELRD